MEKKQYELGDIVQMKKQHPCGTNEMEIIRMGMDIRIKCVGCKHSVLVPRAKFESKLKKVLRSSADKGAEASENGVSGS
ncbi:MULTISPECIES: DUF951 domain-containing protein [Paenibacillus]|uniref:DUF951 domain-containing protein n=1 Tax=Paenibacillus TaxID=44249 RepID=UPI00020D7242|nr:MULTISPECIES: DUF951 domain-containing protein [Paenibacillus]EGL18156.1 hypothetical protein HMPREF9413_6039 [Paenibacillus sp. HGF7]EPD88152.1 hypothetical protein HMPREF1207_02695 [Paenibacillus sp. HGH0039]MBV6715953.1 DUF951 domain-containing protein [Paenibacillus chitinolyticus]